MYLLQILLLYLVFARQFQAIQNLLYIARKRLFNVFIDENLSNTFAHVEFHFIRTLRRLLKFYTSNFFLNIL